MERFNDITVQLTTLSNNFSNNALDGTAAVTKLITEKGDLAGLPASFLAQAAAKVSNSILWPPGNNICIPARLSPGQSQTTCRAAPIESAVIVQASAANNISATADAGPWLITLDAPSYIAVITFADNRQGTGRSSCALPDTLPRACRAVDWPASPLHTDASCGSWQSHTWLFGIAAALW